MYNRPKEELYADERKAMSWWEIKYRDWNDKVKIAKVEIEDGSDMEKSLQKIQNREKVVEIENTASTTPTMPLNRPEMTTDAFK